MHAETSTVRYNGWEWALIWLGFPLAGAAAGWLLKSIAGWVASLEWAPFQGPFKLAASIPEPQATIGAMALGATAGLVLALLSAREAISISIDHDTTTLRRGGEQIGVYARQHVAAVFLDTKHLVLLGSGTAELVREKTDLDAGRIRETFQQHGWPWHAGDPHAAEYRRWVEDEPDLPAAANALLKARARAITSDDTGDMTELRIELGKLGVAVRDENKKQYWRRTR